MKLKSISGAALMFMLASSQLDAEEIELAITCARISPASESEANEIFTILVAKDKILLPVKDTDVIKGKNGDFFEMPVLDEEEHNAVIIAVNSPGYEFGADAFSFDEKSISFYVNFETLDRSSNRTVNSMGQSNDLMEDIEIDRVTGVWKVTSTAIVRESDFQCEKTSNDPIEILQTLRDQVKARISGMIKEAEIEKDAAEAVVKKF